jgi:hypothetical protein
VRIQVLDEAEDDLQDGREFYDRQEPGVGDYLAAALAADIDSLILFAARNACPRRSPIPPYYWDLHI